MGSPKKGTDAYTKKLARSKDARKRARRAKHIQRVLPDLSRAHEQAVKGLRKQVDDLCARKNTLFRDKAKLEAEVKVGKARASFLKGRLAEVKAQNECLVSQVKALSKKNLKAEAESQVAKTKLQEWKLWWAWFQANAGSKAASWANSCGSKPPRKSRDRGWGGGQ